jgi:tRNA wybutosine-synthesizing protein 1
MDDSVKELLEKQGYRLVGGHSAVKVCHWTKERLVRGRSCYKAKFYGIESHRCLQMTPAVAWCQHRCIFCWRPIEHTIGSEFDFEADEPDFVVEESLKKQKALLGGYIGNDKADPGMVHESWEPRHAAISLAGEPTTYPYIDELIKAYHKRSLTTFLVTNGQNPDALEVVKPTQLYLSMIAPNEDIYKRMNVPQLRDGWERLNSSLEIFGQKDTRKVVRITLVRGFNLEHPEKFAKMIEKANPDFIEAKGYVHVGYSRRRLERPDMPSLEEVLEFSEILGTEAGYNIKDHMADSKVALLGKGD